MNGSRAAESMVGQDVLLDWNASATKVRDVVSVVLSWADGAGTRESKNVIDVRTLAAGENLVLGESPDAGLVLPEEILGTDRFEVFTATKDAASVSVPGTANAFVDGVPTLETEIALRPGHSIDLMIGAFVLHFERGTQGRTPTSTLADVLADIGMPGFATSATLHVALLATFAFFLPRLGADDVEELGRDQILLMQKLLNASAEADRERTESTAEAGADLRDGSPNSGGAASRGDSGKMGREQPVERSGHWTQAGDARPSDVTLSRERVIHEVRTEGMIGLLASMAIADPNGPVVPFGTIPNGADKTSNAGDFWSPDPGGAFGVGAGLSGTGEGGGGRADGIGVNDVGDLGKSLSRRNGPGDPGGLGGRHGSLASMPGHTVKSPSMHFDPNVSVTGRLPAEVIQRIVRLSQGRYIACYQSGLRSNPSLEGRVAVRFLISKDGDVAVARDAGSDLPDANVRACIVRAFESLSFPNPEGGGSVSVTYPLVFSPSS